MSIILMRHAESKHNLFKMQIKSKIKEGSVKVSHEYLSIRHCQSFRDDPLTIKGCLQADLIGSTIDWQNVELVLTSPMKRCLETCRRVLSKSEKNIQVKVLPILKGRLSGAWDFGSSIKDLQNSFPEFSFIDLAEEKQMPWYIKIMEQNKQLLYLKHQKFQNKLYQILQEDRSQFQMRISQVKQIIESESKKLKQNKKILVITHSCVLKTLMAQSIDSKGKKKSSYKFENAKPIEFHPSQIFMKNSEHKNIRQRTQDTEAEICQQS